MGTTLVQKERNPTRDCSSMSESDFWRIADATSSRAFSSLGKRAYIACVSISSPQKSAIVPDVLISVLI